MVVSRLKQVIYFESPPVEPNADSYGQIDGPWVNEGARRAEVKKLSGRDIEIANKLFNGARWRIQWKDKLLEIGDIQNWEERDKMWVLLCSEVS